MHGKRNDEYLALSNNFEAGNKIIANTGLVKMYGKKRKLTHTRLFKPVNSKSTTIFVSPGLEIFKGDKLGLLPTSFAAGASDTVMVESYDDETGEVKLYNQTRFYHWGQAESTGNDYNGLDMRGEVLILTRNI